MKIQYITICIAALAVVAFSCDHFAERFAKWKKILIDKFKSASDSTNEHHTSLPLESPKVSKSKHESDLDKSRPGSIKDSIPLDLEGDRHSKISKHNSKSSGYIHPDIFKHKPGTPEKESILEMPKPKHEKDVHTSEEDSDSGDLEHPSLPEIRKPDTGEDTQISEAEENPETSELLDLGGHPDKMEPLKSNDIELPVPQIVSINKGKPVVARKPIEVVWEAADDKNQIKRFLINIASSDDTEIKRGQCEAPCSSFTFKKGVRNSGHYTLSVWAFGSSSLTTAVASKPAEVEVIEGADTSALDENDSEIMSESEAEQERGDPEPEENDSDSELPPITRYWPEQVSIDGSAIIVIYYHYEHDQRPNFLMFNNQSLPVTYREGLGSVRLPWVGSALLIPTDLMRENPKLNGGSVINPDPEPLAPAIDYQEKTKDGISTVTIVYDDREHKGRLNFFRYDGLIYVVHYRGVNGYIEVGDRELALVPKSKAKEEDGEMNPRDIVLPVPEVLPINNGEPVLAKKPFEVAWETADEKKEIKKFQIDIFSNDGSEIIDGEECEAPCSSFTYKKGLKNSGHYTLNVWAVGKSDLTPAVSSHPVAFEVPENPDASASDLGSSSEMAETEHGIHDTSEGEED